MANMGPAAGALCLLAIFSVSLAEEACQSFGGGNVYQEPNRAGGHVLHYSKTISKYGMHFMSAKLGVPSAVAVLRPGVLTCCWEIGACITL